MAAYVSVKDPNGYELHYEVPAPVRTYVTQLEYAIKNRAYENITQLYPDRFKLKKS